MFGLLFLGVALAAPAPGSIQHQGAWSASGIEWRSTVHLGGAGGRVELLAPLPAAPGLSAGAHAVTTAGRVVAIDVDPAVEAFTITCLQVRDDGLFPPLLLGDSLQRVTVDGVDWVADPRLGFEDRLTRTAQPGVDSAMCEGGLGKGHPICFVVDQRVIEAGGLAGELKPRAQTSLGVMLAVGALFAAVVGALLVCNRWLERRGASERLDAYARDEFLK